MRAHPSLSEGLQPTPPRLADPSRQQSLGEDEVQVWTIVVGAGAGGAVDWSLLDNDERTRAARFRADRDRDRFVAHRAFVRRTLAGYLDVPPAAVPIRLGPHDKPYVDADSGLFFNSSRSAGLSALAVARCRVGIDVERLRPLADALSLADGLFAESERRHLRQAPPDRLEDEFLALWTRKEAVVKAFGMGLQHPLDTFDVSCPVGAEQRRWRGRLGAEPYLVERLDCPPGWSGSVAVVGDRVAVCPMDLG